MLRTRNVFAFSPEIGAMDEQAQSFYPSGKYQQLMIKSHFKTVLDFLRFHEPSLKLLKATSRKQQIGATGTVLYIYELYNDSVGHLTDVRLSIEVGTANNRPTVISARNNKHEELKSNKSTVSLSPLQFETHGSYLLTSALSIKRRSYFYLGSDRPLPQPLRLVLRRGDNVVYKFEATDTLPVTTNLSV